MKVFLIDDDQVMSGLLRTFLLLEGFEVANLHTGNGLDELINVLRREKPTVVLLDVHLSHFSGFEVLRRIRQDEELKTTRILMTSGMDLSTQCYEQGGNDFILKPYMPEDLVAKIRNTKEE